MGFNPFIGESGGTIGPLNNSKYQTYIYKKMTGSKRIGLYFLYR